jgi:hypothetical protein
MLVLAAATTVRTVGSVSLLLGDVISRGEVTTVWRTWWLGDACGALPSLRSQSPGLDFARSFDAKPPDRGDVQGSPRRRHWVVAQSSPWSTWFPGSDLAALRFGQRGATVSILIAVGFTVWNTTHLEARSNTRTST